MEAKSGTSLASGMLFVSLYLFSFKKEQMIYIQNPELMEGSTLDYTPSADSLIKFLLLILRLRV